MLSVSQAVLLSWSAPPAASLALGLTAVIYLRGWFLMRRAGVPFVPAWRATCFLFGLLTLWIALASPLDIFSAFVITAHMVQHMLLMMVAPPLLLLGAPLIPMVRGLPVFAAREFAGPFLNWRVAQRAGHAVTNLFVALVLMTTANLAWHTPRLYELALASSAWHEFEHACFFIASLIFWWPVIQPWPSRAAAPRWAVVPYLLAGDVQNTVLSAILVFSDRVLYPSYAKMPRLFGLSAVQDQAASGAIMWVMGSLAFLVPAVILAVQCLANRPPLAEHKGKTKSDWLLTSLTLASRPVSFAYAWLRRRLRVRKLEALTFIVLFAAAGLSLAWLASRPDEDDDQVLRMRAISGPFAVTVLAVPGDLPAGPNGFAFLVQDARTHDVLQDATVDVRARQNQNPQATGSVRASAEDSDNKLLQSAALDLPTSGDWLLLISVRQDAGSSEFRLPLHVVTPDGGFALSWPYVVLIVLAAILLLAYLARRRRASTHREQSKRASAVERASEALEFTRKAL